MPRRASASDLLNARSPSTGSLPPTMATVLAEAKLLCRGRRLSKSRRLPILSKWWKLNPNRTFHSHSKPLSRILMRYWRQDELSALRSSPSTSRSLRRSHPHQLRLCRPRRP